MLKKKGYVFFSLSDILRTESNKRGWGEGRETLQNLGDEMRRNLGNDILPKMIVSTSEFKHADYVVIDSIRHPAEIDYLRDVFDAKTIGVTAPLEILFGFTDKRKRDGDPLTFEEYKKSYERELGKPGGSAMQVEECLKMADVVINNDKTPEHLRAEAEKAFISFGIEAHVHDESNHEMHHH